MNGTIFSVCLIFILRVVQANPAYDELFDKPSTLMLYVWKLSDSINDFAFNLHHEISDNYDKNLVFSPISVANTLAMMHFGARSRTARELEQVLGYEEANITRSMASRAYKNLLTKQLVSIKPRQYMFELANTIFIKDNLGVSATFKRRVEEFYRSPVKLVNFVVNGTKAVAEVNERVRTKTRNKIKRIIDELDASVDVVIVNAAYFRGQWKSAFQSSNTREGIFYNKGYQRKTVTVMEQENVFFYMKNYELSLLELPFKGNNMSIVFVLPKQKDGLIKLENFFTHYKFFENLELMEHKRVLVTIPKFKISYATELSTSLQSLGAIQLFQPSLVNLTGMTSQARVIVGEVKHKATIDFNESGVEVPAASASGSEKSDAMDVEAKFNADHPFMFVVLDKRNGLLLFMGRVWSL